MCFVTSKRLWTEWLFGRCKGVIIIFFQYRHIGDTADRYRCRQADSSIADTDISVSLQTVNYHNLIALWKVMRVLAKHATLYIYTPFMHDHFDILNALPFCQPVTVSRTHRVGSIGRPKSPPNLPSTFAPPEVRTVMSDPNLVHL